MRSLTPHAETAKARALLRAGVLSVAVLLPLQAFAGVTLTGLKGVARVRRPNQASWNEVPVNYVLSAGDELKTDRGAKATLTFDDGSRIELGPNSSYLLEDTSADKSIMSLSFGKLKAWVSTVASRRFAVRTPTAVCSVRGTEFGVDVGHDGATQVALFKGLLAVADQKGNEVLLQPGQHVGVDRNGLSRPAGGGDRKKADASGERERLKREIGLDISKEAILAMAAQEIKQAVYKEGKVMIDVGGNRVRIEEYILRPKPNEFKFVVLNERESRFDFFLRDGTFNTTLPDDLSTALRQLPGCAGGPCQWYLTNYQTIWSNTSDNVHEVASGGHQVDVNNNNVTGDEVKLGFDAGSNSFVAINANTTDNAASNPLKNSNTPFYTTLFDNYTLSFDNVTHTSWVPGVAAYNPAAAGCVGGVGPNCLGIQSMGDSNGNGDQRTVNNVVSIVASPNCSTLDQCTGNRDPGLFHDIIYRQNGLGTVWDKFDNYIIDDNGKIAPWSAFGGNATSGASFKQNLLNWNYEQIITAAEFGPRKIDLVFEPKILIQSGLVP